MSPTATIARDMSAESILRRMQRDTYRQYHKNVEEARKRAAQYKEQAKCRQ